jgi:hypothetical protein
VKRGSEDVTEDIVKDHIIIGTHNQRALLSREGRSTLVVHKEMKIFPFLLDVKQCTEYGEQ